MRVITMASGSETCPKKAGLGAGLESVVRCYFRLIAYSVFVPLASSLVCLNFLTLPAGQTFLSCYPRSLRMRGHG